jgi:ribosome-binding protein aMBF1 (putative translation factor)
MTKLSTLVARWRKEPGFQEAYDALEEEFAYIDLFIRARAAAGLSQAQLARRMKTTQSVIARLEGGRVKPSTRTLQKLAAATGHKLKISLEPANGRGRS